MRLRKERSRMATARSGGILLLGAATAAATCLLGSGGAAGASTPPASSWPSQVAHPVKGSCPRGSTLVAPTSGWTDSLGVAHFSYKKAPGLVTNVPPRGLTASRVSPALIADVGLPAHSAARSSVARREVRQVLNLAKNQTAPAFCRSRARPDKAVLARRSPSGRTSAPGHRFNHVYSGNWGGYAVTEAENGGGMLGVYGSWTNPGSHTISSPSESSTWVGIGGGLGEQSSVWGLIQDGTSMETNEGYRSWFEYVGSSGCTGTLCNVQYTGYDDIRPGDSVSAQVWWVSQTQACFYFSDWTTGTGSISACQASISIPYDHTSVEWVNENWLEYEWYDNPGTVNWSDQAYTDSFNGGGTWKDPFSGSFEAVIMYTSGTPLPPCGNAGLLSYPANPSTSSSGGSSQIITCSESGYDSP